MYPEMTMWALGCQAGEAGGRIKILAINYVRNRKLDDRMMEGKRGVVYVAAVHRPIVR